LWKGLTDHEIHDHENDREYDLTSMIVKPLYFGMLVNIVLPAGLLFVCWFVYNRYYPENHIPSVANTLFYVFCAFALAQAGLALWWRNRKFREPMVRRPESFEHDVGTELFARSRPVFLLIAAITLFARSRPVFLLIAAITLWGYIYFLLTGRFHESVVFIIFSFVVFQVVRPRYGSVRKLIEHQEKLVREGRLVGGSLADIRKEIEGE
jgi:hypothetical protein